MDIFNKHAPLKTKILKGNDSPFMTKQLGELCNKASQKLHALSRISHFMDNKQCQIIMKAFINSQFGYCSLVWMFHSRKMNNRINKIRERSLRIVFNDYRSTFRELLDKDNSVTMKQTSRT